MLGVEAVDHFLLFRQYSFISVYEDKVRVDKSSEKNIMKVEASKSI